MTSEVRLPKFTTHPDPGSGSDWLKQIYLAAQTHQKLYPGLGGEFSFEYGTSAAVIGVPQTLFRGEKSGGISKCQLFSQANVFALMFLPIYPSIMTFKLIVHCTQIRDKKGQTHFTSILQGSVIVSEDRTHDVFGIHSSCHLFNKTLRAHWYGFNDNESEISDFRVAVGRQPNATDVLQFQKVGLVTDVYLPLTNITFDGDIVYVTVESRNSAGLVTRSSSLATRLVAADSDEYIKQGDFYCLNV